MKFEDLKSGTRLRRKAQPAWSNQFDKVRVLARTREADMEYVWVRYIKSDGTDGLLDTLSYANVKSNWEITTPFFELGKTYMLGNREDKWLILETYLIDKPTIGAGKLKAVARMVTPEGKEDIQTLSLWDFERMRQVS